MSFYNRPVLKHDFLNRSNPQLQKSKEARFCARDFEEVSKERIMT